MTVPVHIGYHVSAVGGLLRAWDRAARLGSTGFQVFSSPPRNWLLPKLDPGRIEKDLAHITAKGDRRVVFHAPYLVNLASPVAALRERSIRAVVYGLKLSDLAGGAPLVVHTGTAVDGDLAAALKRLSTSITKIAGRAPEGGTLVFELTAGAGTAIASLPSDVPRLIEGAEGLGNVGICLDTQHLWAAGFNWRAPAASQRLIEELAQLGCLDLLRCVHLNDSKSPRGSRLDRHANLGEGCIGLGPLVEFVTHPVVAGLPVILETPGSETVRSREFKRLQRAIAQKCGEV